MENINKAYLINDRNIKNKTVSYTEMINIARCSCNCTIQNTYTPEIKIKHTCSVYIARGNTKFVLHMYNVTTSLLIKALNTLRSS